MRTDRRGRFGGLQCVPCVYFFADRRNFRLLLSPGISAWNRKKYSYAATSLPNGFFKNAACVAKDGNVTSWSITGRDHSAALFMPFGS